MDVTKLIVNFRNFMNASNSWMNSYIFLHSNTIKVIQRVSKVIANNWLELIMSQCKSD